MNPKIKKQIWRKKIIGYKFSEICDQFGFEKNIKNYSKILRILNERNFLKN